MSDFPPKRRLSGVIAALTGVIVLAAVAGFMNRQLISDFVAASQYNASPEMQSVIDRIELTGAGDRVFRATHPTISSNDEFNAQCKDVEHSESDLVIGCYTGANIHLFRITDARLDGIVEVTAAHEMLHAAFDRLSDDSRAELTDLLLVEYDRLSLESPHLAERMSVYEHLSAQSFANELHSVLGTEVDSLSPELEAHYASLLQNRGSVVELFNRYNAKFAEIESRRATLTASLETLGATIEMERLAYETAVSEFNAESADLSARNSNFEFSNNPALFYSLRDALSDRRIELDAQRSQLNALIDEFNRLRDELIAIDATAQDLIRSIDSEAAPETP